MSSNLRYAEVFEPIGEPIPFKDLGVGEIFMIPETQMNAYWRTRYHEWRPYLSSIVFKKLSSETVQRLMTSLPTPVERVVDNQILAYKVRFIG